MNRHLAVLLLGALCWLAAACGSVAGPTAAPVADPALMAKAVAQATSIAKQVEATSIVLQSRAVATALAQQPDPLGAPAAASPAPALELSPLAEGPAPELAATPTPAGPFPLELLGVSLAANGELLVVHFRAEPPEAQSWQPGSVRLVDKGSGTVYDQVPILPEIGPLVGRPALAGQAGYWILTNPPPGLQPGALVTVLLGEHRFEHVVVQ